MRMLAGLLLVYACAGYAADYCSADIVMGNAAFCRGAANIKNVPVRQQDGTYRDCDITQGVVASCTGASTRRHVAVRQTDGTWQDCDIVMGNTVFCRGLVQSGQFPVER